MMACDELFWVFVIFTFYIFEFSFWLFAVCVCALMYFVCVTQYNVIEAKIMKQQYIIERRKKLLHLDALCTMRSFYFSANQDEMGLYSGRRFIILWENVFFSSLILMPVAIIITHKNKM